MKHWARHLLALAAPLLLTGCLWGPGKFASDLTIKKDGTFTLDYRGEIVIQLPPDTSIALNRGCSVVWFTNAPIGCAPYTGIRGSMAETARRTVATVLSASPAVRTNSAIVGRRSRTQIGNWLSGAYTCTYGGSPVRP